MSALDDLIAAEPVWPKLVKLAACLCAQLEDSGLQPVCFCGVIPGEAVVLDYIHTDGCEFDGMAWVRLTIEYPTVNFPNQLVAPAKCGTEIAFVAEVGIVRSIPLTGEGEPPTAEMYQAATEQQVLEASVMRRAVICCYGDDAILGQYTPVGPSGGALGGFWLVSIPTAS